MPPTALATTGRPFHIASVTVSPKPSRRLFWITTAAWRWSAFTMTAFSSRSSVGRFTRWTRRRTASGRAFARRTASAKTCGASGSSATERTSGPAKTRCASRGISERSAARAKPAMTPAMSLSGSHRDTCSTIGASRGGAGPQRVMSATRSTRDEVPSAWVKTRQAGDSSMPCASPVCTTMAWTCRALSDSFLAEKASMEGWMIVR